MSIISDIKLYVGKIKCKLGLCCIEFADFDREWNDGRCEYCGQLYLVQNTAKYPRKHLCKGEKLRERGAFIVKEVPSCKQK